MWDEDWALLGIAPTTQLTAIKKAYALKLKVTRPDDDAQAYQALRGAYERVQQWAAWEREREQQEAPSPTDLPAELPAELPPDLPAGLHGEPPTGHALEGPPEVPPLAQAPASSPPLVATAPAASPEPAPLTPAGEVPADAVAAAVAPQALIDLLELAWRRNGEAALLQAWPAVRHTLDEQPLARHAEFSAAFARWLVNLPQLPDRLAAALDAHFGWQGDFRTERLIGPALAHAVQAALAERLPPPVDPALRTAAEPLLRLAQLNGARRWWLLHAVLLMLHPALARLQGALGPATLRRLGLDLQAQRWLQEHIKRGLWMRAGLCTLLVGGAAWLQSGQGGAALGQTLYWLACICGCMVLGVFLGAFVNTGPRLSSGERHRALPLVAWRQHRMQPGLALVWLLFAAWLAYMAADGSADLRASPVLALLPDWAWAWASAGFALVGLFVAWPLEAMHGLVLASIAPLVGYLFDAALGPWMPTASAVFIGLAWMLGSAAVFSGRLQAPGPVLWLCRPVMNNLAIAERWSYSLAMLPLAAALAWLALHETQARPLTMFAIWALGLLVTAWVQVRADAVALRWLPTLPEATDGS